jgi:hypothetical protein
MAKINLTWHRIRAKKDKTGKKKGKKNERI